MGDVAGTQKLGLGLEWVFRLVLAGFFILAGLLKIQNPQELVTAIESYQVIPYKASVLLALFMPWSELLAGTGVLTKKLYRGSLLTLTFLLVVFVVALMQGLFRGLDVTCGCFGSSDQQNQTNYAWLITRDIMLIVVACSLWIRHSRTDQQI